MATLSIHTTRKIKCPLLIEANHLESLDKILDEHSAQMQSDLEKRIAEEAAQIVSRLVRKKLVKKDEVEAQEAARRKELSGERRYRQGRSATIYLTKGREINAKSFGEAMTMPIDEDELPVGLSAFIRAGDITATIQTGHYFDPELRVEVEPNDEEVALSLFGALSNWLSGIEAPRWQQKWQEFKFVAGALLLLVLLFGVVFVPLSTWGDAGKNAAIDEARRLLAEGGVNANNEHKAIELLLAMDANPPPGTPKPSLGSKYWLYMSLATLILIAVMIYPRICIGLWKGKRRLHAWRVWMRTLTFGIPSLIGLYILIPWIQYWLKLIPPNP
jgi:hypothetical protein